MTAEHSTEHDENVMTRRFAEFKQIEIDSTLEQLQPEIYLWNEMLFDAKESSITKDDLLRLEEMKQEAIKSLDSKWGDLMGHFMHVTGMWRYPRAAGQGNTVEIAMDDAEAFNVALSDGFQVMDNALGNPRVGLSFAVGNIRLNTPAMQGHAALYAFAEPADVSLMYVCPDEKSVNTDTSTSFVEQLVLNDRLLTLHYSDDNSELFKQSHSKQQRFFSSMTDRMNKTLLSPLNGERAYCTDAQVAYVWEIIQTEKGPTWVKRSPENEDDRIMITGTIQSVEILEAVGSSERSVRLSSTIDLVDPNAGPCLVVQIIESNIGPEFNGKEVYLPVRQSDNLPIALY